MLVHAAAGVLAPGGRLLVYGANDEGAGSAARRIGAVFREVRSVASGGRCRLLVGDGPERDVLRAHPDEWCRSFDPARDELGRAWASFPGVFAHGRLDGGTDLLLDSLPAVPPGARTLDFGCGHGVVGGVVAARTPTARLTFLDVDALALEAVSRNVPGARTLLGDGWGAAGDERWDVVVSNPPFHAGRSESLRLVRELATGAAGRLERDGWLALVTQRRHPVEASLEALFREVAVLGDDGPWRAWHASAPRTVA
jgi:16S rRNA (guanine1207-N2)-methyltransferase